MKPVWVRQRPSLSLSSTCPWVRRASDPVSSGTSSSSCSTDRARSLRDPGFSLDRPCPKRAKPTRPTGKSREAAPPKDFDSFCLLPPARPPARP